MRLMVLALLGLLVACSGARLAVPADSTAPTAAAHDRAQIEHLFERWLAAYESGDPVTLAALFTEDAIYAANTGELLTSRADIRRGAASWMQGSSRVGQQRAHAKLDVERRQLRFRQDGAFAYDLARFTISMAPPGCIIDAGHALAVLEKQSDGSWLIDALTVNQDKAPPPNGCQRR